MPFGGGELFDENNDPLRGGGSYGGQYVNPGGPAAGPPSFFGGGPGGSGGAYSPAFSGGPSGYAPMRRRLMGAGGPPMGGGTMGMGRFAQPSLSIGSMRGMGGMGGQSPFLGPAGQSPQGAPGMGGPPSGGFWNGIQGLPGDPGSWDIPQWNRFSSLLASGDPRLRGTAWDPNGDPSVLNGINDFYHQDALNREQQAVLGAYQDAPNDPGLAGYARTQARLGAMSDASRAAQGYRQNAAQQAAAARYGAFGSLLGSNLNHGLNTQQGLINQYQQNSNRPTFWDYIGGVAGQGLGAFAQGYGQQKGYGYGG